MEGKGKEWEARGGKRNNRREGKGRQQKERERIEGNRRL